MCLFLADWVLEIFYIDICHFFNQYVCPVSDNPSVTATLVQGKYKVFNLCTERLYDAALFGGKVYIYF